MDPVVVVPLSDLSPADWLRAHLVGFEGRVRDVVPAPYEAFARILHQDFGHQPGSGLWSTIAAHCGTTLHPLAQYRMLAGFDPKSLAVQPWVDGAEPEDGTLDRPSLTALRDVLGRHTTTADRCWFALWEGYGGQPRAWRAAPVFALPHRAYHLFAGALADVVDISVEFACAGIGDEGSDIGWFQLSSEEGQPEPPRDWASIAARFRAGGSMQSPNLWWPDDRSWCVASEIDFDSTLVAGSARLVAELVGHPDLEAFEVDPDDLLHHLADRLNMR